MTRMLFRRTAFVILAACSSAFLASCGETETPAADQHAGGKPEILTTFYPTTYFTERLTEGAAAVSCPLPDDADPIFWMPERDDVAAFQNADLIVLNGAGFEKWVDKVSLPEERIVRTAKPLEGDLIRYDEAVTHSHGKAGEHAHEGIDGHTWLDPLNAKIQAGQIKQALIERFPQLEETVVPRFGDLARDLDALHAEFETLEAADGNPPLLASHPAYNYLARRYSWDIRNLDLDPEEMPSDDAIAEMKSILADRPARFILWEAEPLPEIAQRLSDDLGLTSVTFSPAEMVSAEELANGIDYLAIMRRNLANIRPIFLEAGNAEPGQ